eukprot:9700514-Prorocentrum_lima.AAC.1
MDAVVSEDDMLKTRRMDELSEPCLRNPKKLGDVASFVGTMLGEVRIRSDKERTARASRVASARLFPSYPTAAGD